MAYKNKDLLSIIKIQNKTIKAAAASARAYKKELKETVKLYETVFEKYMSEVEISAALRRDKQEVWDERNKAIFDYNALYGLCRLQRITQLPEYEEYELPDGTEVKDCTLDIEGRLMESGRIKPIAHLIKIPEEGCPWHTKFRKKSYSFRDLIKKKKKSRK